MHKQKLNSFYTLQAVSRYVPIRDFHFVGYLVKYNPKCCPATETLDNPACAVMRANVQAEEAANSTTPYYRIVQAMHGTFLPRFVGWMEDNRVCGLQPGTGRIGSPGCALILYSSVGETCQEDN